MNRYSLAAYDSKSKNEVLFAVNLNDKGAYAISDGKSKLAIIDSYTMNFINEEELMYDLIDKELLDRDVKLKIRYQNKGDRETPVLYSNDSSMKPFVNELISKKDDEAISTVATNTEYFNALYNKLLKCSINKPTYIEYLYKNGYINDHLYNRLVEYKSKKHMKYTKLEMLLTSIVRDLSSYKVIRNIYIGTKRYQNKMNVPMEVPKKEIEEDNYLNEQEKYQFDIFLHGGEEELYSQFDKEQISEKVLKKISDFHYRGY